MMEGIRVSQEHLCTRPCVSGRIWCDAVALAPSSLAFSDGACPPITTPLLILGILPEQLPEHPYAVGVQVQSPSGRLRSVNDGSWRDGSHKVCERRWCPGDARVPACGTEDDEPLFISRTPQEVEVIEGFRKAFIAYWIGVFGGGASPDESIVLQYEAEVVKCNNHLAVLGRVG